MHPFRLIRFALVASLLAAAGTSLHAQRFDTAVTFTAVDSSTNTTGTKFWMTGGSVEFGAKIIGNLGIAANLTGVHTNSIGPSNVPLSMLIVTGGPRFRVGKRKASVYVETLFGEANGFRSVFPTSNGVQTNADGFAMKLGGGFDLGLGHHIGYRVVDASYIRTQLPNAGSNAEGNLSLSTGLLFHF
ncbi:MAG TPA: hypothetical protein VGN16_20040 [Acidobacteriaceae bacterium]